jgi:trigger factor
MKVQVESLDKVRKNVEVILDEEKISEIREDIYEDLKKNAKIKGFRPGKVPRSVIQAYYKEYIDDELRRKIVEQTMADALSETKIHPISEPHIHFAEEENKFGYTMECEVTPEFDLPEYQGIETEVAKISVSDEDIVARLERMRQMHAEVVDKAPTEPAEKGDLLMVQYQGFRDGEPVKEIKADSYPIDLSGNTGLMPEFEAGLVGIIVGEKRPIEVNFEEDYPDKDIAGKTVVFQVEAKEIKKRVLPKEDDDFAKDVGFESLDALKTNTEKEIEKEQETYRKRVMSQQIADYLISKTDIPVPQRLLEKRVEQTVQDARSRMKSDKMNEEDENGLLSAMHLRYEPEVEKRIKMEFVLAKIAEREGIAVEESEIEDRLKKIAEETKRAYDHIRDFYDKYDLTANLRNSMLEEKTINFLLDKAVVKEKVKEQA